ncbi:hypothetical protein ACC685_39295, partial [Rhizobium ruizarguesonis]
AITGRRKGMTFDPELLYTAAMFHYIGLTAHYENSQLRFEVDGSNAARDFLKSYGVTNNEDGEQPGWFRLARVAAHRV